MAFCLGVGVPRHSAGGVAMFVHTYICGGTYGSQCACANNGSGELYQSYYIYIYTSENVFTALGNDYGFHEYTYRDREYIIRL